jgi:hypothetical protein
MPLLTNLVGANGDTMKRLLILPAVFVLFFFASDNSDEWIPLFDGETLEGWQASDNADSWQIEDGALVTRGPRSHLFYVGDLNDHNFKNFEFSADVKTTPGSNSGIYFHTEYQDSGWPSRGYEAQVFNASPDIEPGWRVERKHTGSIYGIRNIWKPPVNNDEWFSYRFVVLGKTIRTYINGALMADYTEPEAVERPRSMRGRVLSSGTFALQCHDPRSVVYFRDIKVKVLPDDLPTPGEPAQDPDYENRLMALSLFNFPLMDLHVHVRGDLTNELALAHARRYGFTYGFAVNCGLMMGFEGDEELNRFIDSYEQPPETYFAMQAEGREWLDMFSQETIDRFDYVFTDAMTWTNDAGRRMRLWMPNETEVGDPEDFMDQLVDRIETILSNEPIDIYVNPTFLPPEISQMYDELWTEDRMDRVIAALVENEIALEINDRYRLPSVTFIRRAKAGGVKFTFGTNNGSLRDLGRLEYCIDMVDQAGLTAADMWIPPRR